MTDSSEYQKEKLVIDNFIEIENVKKLNLLIRNFKINRSTTKYIFSKVYRRRTTQKSRK